MLRSLFALKGAHKQVDIAKAIYLSENSVVRMFKGYKINRGTAMRIADYLERTVDELFEESLPKELAVVSNLVAVSA
jgi:DNA-binding XRE family transcriptional regulator